MQYNIHKNAMFEAMRVARLKRIQRFAGRMLCLTLLSGCAVLFVMAIGELLTH